MSTKIIDDFFEKEKIGEDLDNNFLIYNKKSNMKSKSKHSREHTRKMFLTKEKNACLAQQHCDVITTSMMMRKYVKENINDIYSGNFDSEIKTKLYTINLERINSNIYHIVTYNNLIDEVKENYIKILTNDYGELYFLTFLSLKEAKNDKYKLRFYFETEKMFPLYYKHYYINSRYWKKHANRIIRRKHFYDDNNFEINYNHKTNIYKKMFDYKNEIY